MNKLLSRLSALTLLAIAVFAVVLFLKDKAPTKSGSAPTNLTANAATAQNDALSGPVEAQTAASQSPAHNHTHTASTPKTVPLPTISKENRLATALSASLQRMESRKVSIARFEKLRTAKTGDVVQLDIADIQIAGTISGLERKNGFQKFGIQLNSGEGTMFVNLTPKKKIKAHILFDEETHVFTLNGNTEGKSAILEKKTINDIYCAPNQATPAQRLGLTAINAPVYTPSVPAPEDGDIPILNSTPGSDYVVYLDLDGEVVNDPFWTERNNDQTINAAPMADATNASWVTAIFRRICEDYVPFDVNVTTDFAVFNAADVEKRVQCVFTSTNFEGPGTGGIAGLGTFGNDTVCWVFWENEYRAAYAASHEVGHTLHLKHDSTNAREATAAIPGTTYYPGHGDGETSWAPLMGNGDITVSDPFKYPNVTQWSIGDYSDANNQEDDLAIITTQNNGLSYREDDYGDLPLLAETLSATAGVISHYGIIETTDDQDWFKFVTVGGPIQIAADVTDIMSTEGHTGSLTYGTNLAIELTLYDVNGVQIDQSSATTSTLGATLTTNLSLGEATYYIGIDGAGRKDPLTDGFSDYGSLGEYLITGNFSTTSIILLGGDNQDQLVGLGADATPTNGTAFGFATDATSHQFTITNSGVSAVSITDISSDATEFTIDTFTPTTLNAGESQTFDVTFDAVANRLYSATITVNYDDGSAQAYPFAVSATKSNVGGDDNYEQNDTFFEPYNLSDSPGISLQFLLGYGIQNDNDWFQITVPAGNNQINAQCDFINSLGNIDLLLYDQNGYLLWTESSSDDNETLSYLLPNTDGGTFFLLVKSAAGSAFPTGNFYDLTWNYETIAIIPPAAEDSYEENDDYNDAEDISNEPILSNFEGLGTQLDNDWFKFKTPAGDNRLDISCTFDNAAGNIDIAVYDYRGYLIITSTGSTDAEQIAIPISYPGEFYYVLVKSAGSVATGNTYDLEWATSFVSVFDDFYEENDTISTATQALTDPDVRLSDNSILGEAIQFDDDWFEFTPAFDTVVMLIHAEFPAAVGDIQIDAYDFNGNLITTGTATSDGAFVNIEVHGQSPFYLEVTGDDIGDTYDLYYENLTEDKYDPNNSAAAATDLTSQNGIPLSQIEGSGIQNDVDWYKYDVPVGAFSLTVDVAFRHSEGDLDMTLTAPDGTLVGTSAGVGDTEQIIILPIPPAETIPEGVYALRLYGFAGNHNSAYDLVFTVVDPLPTPPPAPEDNYEVNNTHLDPSTVLSDSSQRGVLLSSINGYGTQLDADWYQITVPSGQNMVTVHCDFINYAEGNIDMALYTSGGSPVATSATTTDDETITYLAAASGGTYLIQITGVNAGITYDLSWTSVSPPAEDAYEPSSFGDPTDIDSGSWLSLINGKGIQYNQDWYSFTTTGKNLISLVCEFTHSEQDNLRMVLYRNGYEVESSDGSDNHETIIYRDSIGGSASYKVLIDGSDNGTSYDLIWNATALDATTPVEDNYEDNDDYFEAYSLSNHEGIWLSAIDGNGVKIDNDNDWYRIDVPAGKASVHIDSFVVDSDYDLYLRDKDGRVMSSISGGSESSITPNSDGDTFYLEIRSSFNGTQYDIAWYSTDLSAVNLDVDSDQLADAWEQANGLSISANNTDENLDADRYPNWAEYTLNLDPNVFSSNVVRQFQDSNYTYIQFTQRKDAIENGYTIIVKESPTLSFSSDQAVHVSTVASPDYSEVEIVTYRCSSTLTEAPTCFFMLEINKPE
jgi:hypothetical protein